MKTINIYFSILLTSTALLVGGCSKEESTPANTAPIPRIISLSPVNAIAGDTLSIVGINFSEKEEENKVKLGQTFVEIVAVTDTMIQVVVPEISGTSFGVSVRSRGKISNKMILSLLVSKIFEDNFDRPDVPPVGSSVVPNPIGSNWQIIDGVFAIKGNRLFSDAGGKEAYVLYRDPELDMKVGEGSHFTLSANMVSSPESFAGVIFNAQSDNQSCYILRTTNNLLQLLKLGGGGLGVLINQPVDGFASNVPYHVIVSSAQPGIFHIEVSNMNNNGILFKQTVEDPNPYLGGSPGFYYFGLANPVTIMFDDFHLELQ